MALSAAPGWGGRLLLALAAGGSALGVALAATVSQSAGGAVVVASWVSFLYALHAFGRHPPR